MVRNGLPPFFHRKRKGEQAGKRLSISTLVWADYTRSMLRWLR